MKRKYLNITIPYKYYNNKTLENGYIYKDKFWTNLNDLFWNFLGSFLSYHVLVNNEEIEVHSLEEVIYYLTKYPNNFEIPNKYKNEYSNIEYKSINKFHKDLLNNNLEIIEYYPLKKWRFRKFDDYRWHRALKEAQKYKDVIFPIKVYNKVYKREVYVLKGEIYKSLIYALEHISSLSFYYQYNGDGKKDSYNHNHSHEFELVIDRVIEDKDFKIYDFQEEFYSKQELELIKKLQLKLTKMNFERIDLYYNSLNKNNLKKKWYDKIRNYEKEKKYLRAFIYEKKVRYLENKIKKYNLSNYKIKEKR